MKYRIACSKGAVGIALVANLVGMSAASAICLDPAGDTNGSGSTSVADSVCIVLATLWDAAGQVGAAPACLDPALTPLDAADLNCDGSITVSDVLITVGLALDAGLSPAVDTNGDDCADACEIPPNTAPTLIGGDTIGPLPGGQMDLDVTAAVLALFTDAEGDTPLALNLAANADETCITGVSFDAGTATVDTAAMTCTGSFQVQVRDAAGEAGPFVTIQAEVEVVTAFSQADGTPIGNVGQDVAGHTTFGANISAAYDGNTSQSHGNCARRNDNQGFALIGKDWGAGASRVVTRYELYSSNTLGFHNPENNNNRVILQGSNDGTNFTNLHTSAVIGDFSGTVVFDETTGAGPADAYRYHRLRIEVLQNPGINNCCNIAEAIFYGYDAP